MSDFPTKNPLTLAQLEKMGVRNLAADVANRVEFRTHINFIMFLGMDYEPDEEFETAAEQERK